MSAHDKARLSVRWKGGVLVQEVAALHESPRRHPPRLRKSFGTNGGRTFFGFCPAEGNRGATILLQSKMASGTLRTAASVS